MDRTGLTHAATPFERRRTPRLVPDPAGSLCRVRSRTGRELDVIDLSSGGLLIEGNWRALPNTHLDVHLVTAHGRVLVRCRVVRAYVCDVSATLVRYRAGLPGLTPSQLNDQAEVQKQIERERMVEFLWENRRFYDVRRWKIAEVTESKPAQGINITKSGTTLTYATKVALDGRAFNARMYWLPIPRAEIQASGNKLQQNTGYTQ